MVHIVRIKDGQASYCNRFVDTARLRQERAAGFPIFSKVTFGFSLVSGEQKLASRGHRGGCIAACRQPHVVATFVNGNAACDMQ